MPLVKFSNNGEHAEEFCDAVEFVVKYGIVYANLLDYKGEHNEPYSKLSIPVAMITFIVSENL